MKHRISHDLGSKLAARATKAAFEAYRKKFEQYDPKATWKTDTQADVAFKVKLVTLKGSLSITDTSVDLQLDVPRVFRVFKDRAVRAIDSEVRQWIDKAKRGELD